jgi:hypothetical protein
MDVSRRAVLAAAVGGGAAALLGGCGRAAKDEPEPTPAPTPREGTGPPVLPDREPPPAPGEPGPLSPFTGLTAAPGPVLGVKIDNAPRARPGTGLEQADLIYGLPVEGGLSRLLAVFSSSVPDVVGPVRSARQSDLLLLAQYGAAAVAYSGSHSALRPALSDSPLVRLTEDTAPGWYFRGSGRVAPHNLYLRAADALAAVPGVALAPDIGFRFGDPPRGGERTDERRVNYASASFGFRWSTAGKRWLVDLDGSPAVLENGAELGAATVVLQRVAFGSTTLGDPATPYPVTTGSGTATVLREGRAYPARWERPTAGGGTTFTTESGEPFRFARGQVWVVISA